jgi:hypothetical protein
MVQQSIHLEITAMATWARQLRIEIKNTTLQELNAIFSDNNHPGQYP